MIIHGGTDNVSPAERAVKMNEVLTAMGHKVSFHLFPLNGHNYHAEKYLGLTLDFFDAHRRAPKP
jgi:dipeptidyl aminopeptidase/acylaminoacyl peptidase